MINPYDLALISSVLFVFVQGLLWGQYVKAKGSTLLHGQQKRKFADIRLAAMILTGGYVATMLVLLTGEPT